MSNSNNFNEEDYSAILNELSVVPLKEGPIFLDDNKKGDTWHDKLVIH